MILIRLTGNNIVQKKIFRHLILKKNLKRFLTEYIPDIRFIHHKRNHFIMTIVNAAFF